MQLDLSGAGLREIDLSESVLRHANLSEAILDSVNLEDADVGWSYMPGAKLRGARLKRTDFGWALMEHADLTEADLRGANMHGARLCGANLDGANLGVSHSDADFIVYDGARLCGANLVGANLREANLSGVNLNGTDLSGAVLENADFSAAMCCQTCWSTVNLSKAIGLETIRHEAWSTIGVDTLQLSMGKIPEEFLRGCGLSPWEVKSARLYDPELSPSEIAEMLSTDIFMGRTEEMPYPGIFISYSHFDSNFANKLRGRLYGEGLSVWLDRHDMVAGDLEKQIGRALRSRDVVLLVLSCHSLRSDWVWLEIETALRKEEDENRDVLCPITLDGSWQEHQDDQVLMRRVKKKNILDFSKWKTKRFDAEFEKLLKGLKANYERLSGAEV